MTRRRSSILPGRSFGPRRLATLCAASLLCVASYAGAGIQLPAGFVSESLPFVFDVPTSIAFLPDGALLVAEKGGIVYVVRDGVRHPFWVHEDEVLNTDDRGLLSVAVDPHFAANRRVYFFLTVDPDSNGVELDNYDDAFARLLRYEVSATNPDAVDESSRSVLIGTTWADGFPSGSGTHTVASLAWGADGSLLASAGDGAHFEQMDAGGLDPGMFVAGRVAPAQDIGAFRAQDLASLDGKVLRIDPETGLGLPGNPFWDGDAGSVRSRVWAYGLRNPFRMARRPNTGSTNPADADPGTLYVGDVGWNTWEELDVIRTGGPNFGWPCFEGPGSSDSYPSASPAHHGCASIGTVANPSMPSLPLLAFHHQDPSLSVPPGSRGGVVTGGAFYTGTGYPGLYHDTFFFGDYMRGWIKALKTDASDQAVGLLDFATGADGPVCFATDPTTGDLWYVSIWTGEIRRIRYVGTAAVPTPAVDQQLSMPRPNPTTGAIALALELPEAAAVRFAVFDVGGREVWRAPERNLPAGASVLLWPGLRSAGGPVGSGVYLARIQAGSRTWTRRFALVR